MKLHDSCEAAVAAVDEVLAIARRAAEERGVKLVAIAVGANAVDHAHVGADYVGCSAVRALEIAALGVGAVHSRAAVDFGHAGIHKAMESGFDHGLSILRTPHAEGVEPLRVVPSEGVH